MSTAVFAEKLGMTHIYDDNNRHIPVTILKVTPQVITGIRTKEKHGYDAVQIGTEGSKRVSKPQVDELKKQNIDLHIAHRTEIRSADEAQGTVGDLINVSVFAPGDMVTVSGTSKGKGFAGTIKRHNFARGPVTHGSKNIRKPGSIGGGYPQRVILGMRMSGHMGHVNVTTKGHKVMAINPTDNTIAVSGTVPGSRNTRIVLKKVTKESL